MILTPQLEPGAWSLEVVVRRLTLRVRNGISHAPQRGTVRRKGADERRVSDMVRVTRLLAERRKRGHAAWFFMYHVDGADARDRE